MIEEIVFLIGKKSGAWGSGHLRSNQLLDIISERLANTGLRFRLSDDPQSCRNSLIVVSKTYIYDNSALRILALKDRGNVIACDFVDLPPRRNVCKISDILISSSHLQDDFLRASYPNKTVIFLPHHADLRIEVEVDRGRDVQAGYFGAPYNALFVDELRKEKLCDVVRVDDVANTAWIEELRNFKIHYAVRSRQRFDGYKPFTKGSIAAAVGAVILTEREPETVRCLGETYPFFVDAGSYENVRNALSTMRRTENDQSWKDALSAMAKLKAKCSPDRIAEIFTEMIASARTIAASSPKAGLSALESATFFSSEIVLQQVRALKQLKRRVLNR